MFTGSPSSQKAEVRPISFVLDDQATGGGPASVDLVIRPEDLTRNDPSRLNVQQTLGGAWADNFGPGIATIQINGHTGWRPTYGSGDGEARFQQLQDQVFTQWHARRAAAVKAGLDPDLVKLVFADSLDGTTDVVAPMTFTLRRSRSRPLLMQYQINMTVLGNSLDGGGLFGSIDELLGSLGAGADVMQAAGLDSLTASINEITGDINDAHKWLDHTLVAPVKEFMGQTARLYGAVRGAISAADGIAGSLISVAQMTAQAGINIFRTAAAIANIPSMAKARLMQVAGSYTNIWCVLHNALRQQVYYPDYSPLFGASNCSSTSGGRPISVLSGQNPFYSVVPTSGPLPVTLTATAQSSLRTLAANDPVLAPLSTADLSSAVKTITDGLAVAA